MEFPAVAMERSSMWHVPENGPWNLVRHTVNFCFKNAVELITINP